MKRLIGICALLVVAPLLTMAQQTGDQPQSLGDLARRVRKEKKEPTRVITNDDLAGGSLKGTTPAQPKPATPAAKTAPKPRTEATTKPPAEVAAPKPRADTKVEKPVAAATAAKPSAEVSTPKPRAEAATPKPAAVPEPVERVAPPVEVAEPKPATRAVAPATAAEVRAPKPSPEKKQDFTDDELRKRDADFRSRYLKQKELAAKLERELEVMENRLVVMNTRFYSDIGARVRNDDNWLGKRQELMEQADKKRQQVNAANQALDDLKDQGRRAGVPASVFE